MTNDNDNSVRVSSVQILFEPNNQAHIILENMTLLQTMGAAMILMDKVHQRLVGMGNKEMAELVASVCQAQAALYQLADANSKGN